MRHLHRLAGIRGKKCRAQRNIVNMTSRGIQPRQLLDAESLGGCLLREHPAPYLRSLSHLGERKIHHEPDPP